MNDYGSLGPSCIRPVRQGKTLYPNAEKVRQRRSQLTETLNVPPSVRFRFRLAVAFLGTRRVSARLGLGG
jgi:hypothetical protein